MVDAPRVSVARSRAPVRMSRIPLLVLLALLFAFGPAATAAQDDVSRATLTYTPESNGYEVQLPFAWKFIDCYGEVHLTITRKNREATSGAYIFEGERYTAAELGAEAFEKPEVGLTDATADVYEGAARLGTTPLKNVIDYLGGCFGQTYNVLKNVGLDPKAFRDRIGSLSITNLRLDYVATRDYKLEGRIRELAKAREADAAVRRGDSARSGGDLAAAEDAYEEALATDPSSERAREALAETRSARAEAEADSAYTTAMEEGRRQEGAGELSAARDAYGRALRVRPEDSAARAALDAVEARLESRAAVQRDREAAVSEAMSRRHSGTFWGTNLGSDSHGSATQAASLIGRFRVDYDLWALGGEPAHRFRFYWEWSDFQHTGYPLWVSVLGDDVLRIADLARYPDLLERWNAIKPLYIEVESDILYWKHGEEWVADAGTIRVIPSLIGRAGQEVDYGAAASSSWDELFTYTNGMGWGYFDGLGLGEEIRDYTDRFGTEVGWPRYAFLYSDEIDFFQDYQQHSSSADLTRIVWPVEEIEAVIAAYQRREKAREESGMAASEFWNTPESTDVADEEGGYWESPEDATTVAQRGAQRQRGEAEAAMGQWRELVTRWRKKYEAMQSPIGVAEPASGSTVQTGQVTVRGKLHPFIGATARGATLRVGDEEITASVSGGQFSGDIILSEGWNSIAVVADAGDFAVSDSLRIFYDKPPPLPCDERTASGSGSAIYEHGLGKEKGTFRLTRDFYGAWDDMVIYPGPKERRHQVQPIYSTSGKYEGSGVVDFHIESGIITVVLNEGAGGSSWEYTIHCP